MGERSPGKHKVDRGEAHVEVVVQFGKLGVERAADFLALERSRGGVDGQFSHDLGNIESALLSLESLVALEKVFAFLRDEGYVGAESLLRQAKLDKLSGVSRS